MDHQLLTFITVAEKESFTRAAENLHLTQAAVTLSIKSLEKKYNAKLFDRTSKYVRLTKAGNILYHHGKKIINQYKQTYKLIDDLSNSTKGNLFISSSFTFGEYILPKLIANFNQLFPDINIDISIRNSARVISQLHKGELDLGIVEGNVEGSNLLIQPFAKDEMMVCVSKNHRLAGENEISLTDLANETWIIREQGSGTRQAINKLFADNAFHPAIVRTYGSPQIIKESVETELGVSVLSTWITRREVSLGTICLLRVKNNPITRNFSYAITKSEFRPNITDLFLEFLRKHSYATY